MALFKIFKGRDFDALSTNRPEAVEGYCYFTTEDQKMYIDIDSGSIADGIGTRVSLNATHADTADRLIYGNGMPIGSETKPIWLNADGEPSECDDILAVGISGGLHDVNGTLRKVGTAEKPIYFEDGLPVECNDTLAVNISKNAATATQADKAYEADVAEVAIGATQLIDYVTK